jgi:hypothetical protein
MHKHDEHTVDCDQYVPKGPDMSRGKSGYRSRQWMVGVLNGGLATDYRWGDHVNRLFWGDDAERFARANAECTGATYRPEVRPGSGRVYHVVRFDHHA